MTSSAEQKHGSPPRQVLASDEAAMRAARLNAYAREFCRSRRVEADEVVLAWSATLAAAFTFDDRSLDGAPPNGWLRSLHDRPTRDAKPVPTRLDHEDSLTPGRRALIDACLRHCTDRVHHLHPTIEAFRAAWWIEYSQGSRRFGLDPERLRSVRRRYPPPGLYCSLLRKGRLFLERLDGRHISSPSGRQRPSATKRRLSSAGSTS